MNHFDRRRALLMVPGILGLGVLPLTAMAAAFPSKPIRWVVGYAAGGGSDFVARAVGQVWSEQIAQSVVIDNKPGANTAVAAADVAYAHADGYTVGFVDNATMVINPLLYKKLPYDPAKQLRCVTQIGRMPCILAVNPGTGIDSVEEYVRQAKAKPGAITYGSPGAGNTFHLAMELFNSEAGIATVHAPYKGAAPALADLVAGHVQSMMVDLAASAPFIKSGKIKAIAVAHTARLSGLPNVQTFAEVGYPKVVAAALQGVVVPTDVPADIVGSLNASLIAAIKHPTVSQKLIDYGIEPVAGTPQEFADVLAADKRRWAKVITDLKISLD